MHLREKEIHWHHASPNGQGLYCLAISSLAYLSLRTISSDSTVDEIQKKLRERIAVKLPPGLKEQYEIQLRSIKNEEAECEFIFYPGCYSPTGKPHPSFPSTMQNWRLVSVGPPDKDKCYATLIISMHRPFSRGTIVCRKSCHLIVTIPGLIHFLSIFLREIHVSNPSLILIILKKT